MPPVDFSTYTKKQRAELLRDYLAQREPKLRWLRDLTELDLVPGRQALIDFWTWVLAWDSAGGYDEPFDVPLPVWHEFDAARDYLTRAQIQLNEAGTHLIIASLQAAIPGSEIRTEQTRGDIVEGQPVLTTGDPKFVPVPAFAQLGAMFSGLNRLREEGDAADAHLKLILDPAVLTVQYDRNRA